jgi:hypothetical protein
MKLTNTMRDAFIRQAMADVPTIDYSEKIRAATLKAALKLAPKSVQTAWADVETRRWIETTTVHLAGQGITIPSLSDYDGRVKHKEAVCAEAALATLIASADGQKAQHEELRTRLRAVAYSVSTTKALADTMPEFAKYLPADDAASLRTLPVVANVVSDFVKAGWPKGGKVASKKAAASA